MPRVSSVLLVPPVCFGGSQSWVCSLLLSLTVASLLLLQLDFVEGFIHIEGRPADQDVVEGSRARIVCKTSSDPLDSSQLHLRWLVNGRALNVSLDSGAGISSGGSSSSTSSSSSSGSGSSGGGGGGGVGGGGGGGKYVQKSDKNRHALIIKNARLEDSGSYTCVASLGLDSDRATAFLTVKSRPGPPQNLTIRSVHGNRAELVWEAGSDHGAKVLSYLLQFNTSDSPGVWYDYFESIIGEKVHYFVELPPWGTYTFRLLARNELGLGQPSSPTPQSCTTPPDRPDRNPKNVVTLTHKKQYLVVEWTPMHRLEFHGPGFRYNVYWRRKGSLSWNNALVNDSARGHFEREVKDVFQEYEIQVRAMNELGEAHQPPFTYQGRSGEAEPFVRPRDFRKDPSKPVESHSAYFIWEAVEISDKIRGEFRGYRLQYWKSSEGRHKMQEVDVSVSAQPPVGHPVVRASLRGLPANTALRAQVAVRNTHYTGLPSMTIDFFTPEGTPTAVRSLSTLEVEEQYVILHWLPPEEPNGRLIGFDVGYQPVDGTQIGEERDLMPRIKDPAKLQAKITGLQPASSYRFVVWARTQAGRGRKAFVDVQTKQGSSYYTHKSGGSPTMLSPRHWTTVLTSLAWLLVVRTVTRGTVSL